MIGISHLQWWQLSDDEKSVEVHSVIGLKLRYKTHILSERVLSLPCKRQKGAEDELVE